MKRLEILIFVLLFCFIPACAPSPAQYTPLESRILEAEESQSILIQIDHGDVRLVGHKEQTVWVDGEAMDPSELEVQVESMEDLIFIKVLTNRRNASNASVRLDVHIPDQTPVQVETDSASIRVQEFQGELEVDTTSGNILIEHATGRLTLWSNRGDITVRESKGTISIVGNYGTLKANNVHGETGMSTIMGNIIFDGSIQAGDWVHLETDHGPVSIKLGPDSNMRIQVRSTSGHLACMLPDMSSSARSCDGRMGTGTGQLDIRTVSGEVTLMQIP